VRANGRGIIGRVSFVGGVEKPRKFLRAFGKLGGRLKLDVHIGFRSLIL
jgi:hypothetical protein